ncbi:capsular polysaccharide biosynthesis protein [Roseovarius sp. D22-M7]|uniref:capsular polysaccharide biosynthesis protein n=1 Tax=Roseovarius sp. D22-M7 TaxID=3127116 RepID=UPI0030104D75
MTSGPGAEAAKATPRRRLFHFNAGFLWQARLRRILSLAGYDLRLGWPSPDDSVAVWGRSPYAWRGDAVAARTGAGLLRIEDGFLRSLFPGREGAPPLGLLLDQRGVHFDASQPSDLEHLLATHPLSDPALMIRAHGCIARLQEAHLTKYSAVDPSLPCPDPGYVLVIDQTRGDASITRGGADTATFRAMLDHARRDNPGVPVLIKTHPETLRGHRPGHFSTADAGDHTRLVEDPLSPWTLLAGARAVYTVTSQMGFEAICAGHRPQVFGQPFYAGWGLTADRHPHPLPRRGRNLSAEQLFAAAMLLYPVWYDPHRDRLCDAETAIEALAAETRAWREDRRGWTAHGMRLWKRAPLQRFFGRHARLRFGDTPGHDRPAMVWATRAGTALGIATRVEDGFLRSRGLGAELVPPLSLVLDDLGIYYDPSRESRLERLIAARETLRADQLRRAKRLIAALARHGLSKYNRGAAPLALPDGQRILVPGQVEDDASIATGAGAIASNLALLQTVRVENPDAVILYKPHPDVEAGLRPGALPASALRDLADVTLTDTDPAPLLSQINAVWTMTSLLGFEALLRGVPVTTTGAPFYAGWGLTRDLGKIPARRTARPALAGLVHATLIDYPRYLDPVTGTPCPVEVVVDRLAHGPLPDPGRPNRLLARLQGAMATHAHLWR